MQLALPGSPHLTYCTNIHAGERWSDIEDALSTYLPTVKWLVSPTRPMGIGLRLSGAAAADLGEPRALASLIDFLKRADLYVFTINAFPYGSFHGTRVKEQVYEPDWRHEGRLHFTNHVANIMAKLLPEGLEGSISTVPGAYKASVAGEADIARMASAMVRHAAHLHDLARATGKQIVLALEPEPCCFLETTDEAIAFFEDYLFSEDAVANFRRLAHTSAAEARQALQRHLGVCLDVCHAAVEFEDPVDSVERLDAAGIRVAKIQLSSALKLPNVGADTAELLLPFDDGVYLHQTIESRDGTLTRYADLPDALAALHRGNAGGEWRVHCHVPLFQSSYGALQSTQQPLAELLATCRTRALTPHLEVETYTWGVLPAQMRDSDVGSDIARELTWVRSQLGA
jgi:sugar phosphate isomerase/epimerase